MTELHTEQCRRTTVAIDEAIALFDRQHPKACRTCGGLGWINDPDHSVGMSWNPAPCGDCEDRSIERGGPICAVCATPGDFTARTYEDDAADVRPCGCAVHLERPQRDGCGCRFVLDDADIARPDYGTTVETIPYDYAADDRAFDEHRERAATRSIGRD